MVEADEPQSLFSDEAEASAGDRLLFDAADLALKDEPAQRFADEFAEPPVAKPEPPPRRSRRTPIAAQSFACVRRLMIVEMALTNWGSRFQRFFQRLLQP